MRYWLVQRLSLAHPDNGKKGFDSLFELEDMGSTKYEFRTPHESLQRMRAVTLVVVRRDIVRDSDGALVPVYFVAAEARLQDKVDALQVWLGNPRSPEPSYFPTALAAWPDRPKFPERTVAWWSFQDDIAWTLNPDVAARLVAAFGTQTSAQLRHKEDARG